MHPIYDKLGEAPELSKHRDLDRFLFISEAALGGECDLPPEELRGELLRLLPAAKISVKCLAAFDAASNANERAESTLRASAARRLGEIRQVIDIALGTAVNAKPHELMPDDWCERQLRSLADLLERVAIALEELHESMLPIHPKPVSRESGGQPAARHGTPPAGPGTNAVAEGRPDLDDIPY